MKKINELKNAKELWNISGSFGEFNGDLKTDGNNVFCETDILRVVLTH